MCRNSVKVTPEMCKILVKVTPEMCKKLLYLQRHLNVQIMIERDIINELKVWKSDEFRKPLVLRGARQTGKTTVVNMFGKLFKQYIYLNLEEENSKNLFLKYKEIDKLVEAIFFENNKKRQVTDTLIFIDEIQEVPQALTMLRYFYEKYPQYCVVAAGSLLESLFDTKISFPVGRVE